MKALFILIFFSAFFAKAHPVIYKDGFVYWGEFSNQKNTQILSYTFHPRFAFQFSSDFKKNKSFKKADKKFNKNTAYLLGLNVLAKRWLLGDSQGNIYTSLQGGISTDGLRGPDKSEKKIQIADRLNFQWNLMADWESRKVYTAGMIALKGVSGVPKTLWGDFSYRIGFAPYVAGMDTLQTWFVVMFQASTLGTIEKSMKNSLLEAQKQRKFGYRKTLNLGNSTLGFNWTVTPLLRFFYKNVLWEIGSSLKSDFYLTLMVHY